MRFAGSRFGFGLMMTLLVLLLSGCQKVELYSNLTEREGNEILAVLLGHDIAATKSRAKEFVTISVPESEVARAIELLRQQGFPRERFTDLGQIFQKQGLISSPMEERVRYTYGLSQMLAETLTQIDGVLAARVLIVLPEEAAFGQKPVPSSASVFVKYRPSVEIEDSISRIKTLVQNSVDGLSYDKISVALFPQYESPQTSMLGASLGDANRDAASPWPWVAALLGALLILSSGASAYLWRRMRQSAGTLKTADNDG